MFSEANGDAFVGRATSSLNITADEFDGLCCVITLWTIYTHVANKLKGNRLQS